MKKSIMSYLIILFGISLICLGAYGIKQGMSYVMSDQVITTLTYSRMKLQGAGSVLILIGGILIITSKQGIKWK